MVGRYSSAGPARVVLRGDVSGRERRFELEATLAGHSQTDANEYVEKLWATRRIGEIIDDLDLNGRNQELIDELVALSLRHGIMTPYTSFLADEGVRLTDSRRNRTQAAELLERLSESSGESAFFQRDMKRQLQSARSAADTAESFGLPASGGRGRGTRLSLGQKASDAAGSPSDLNRGGEVATRRHEAMRRIGSKTFYWKDARWLDADLGEKRQDVDSKVIEIRQFSPEYFELAAKDKGKWARYLALQEPVEILLEGRRYRILPPEADVSGK